MAMVHIENRSIYLIDGKKTQTLNICSTKNIKGEYEFVFRFPYGHFIDSMDISSMESIEALIENIVNRDYVSIEKSYQHNENEAFIEKIKGDSSIVKTQVAEQWINKAKTEIESTIDKLLDEFLIKPYLHRVEHSFHTRIIEELKKKDIFCVEVMNQNNITFQLVHKEWPETKAREEKNGRRGNFDIAIIAPERCRDSTVDQFNLGLIKPTFVVEIGLNYNLGHLSGDYDKLQNSEIENGYLIHLLREINHDTEIENFFNSCDDQNIKIGYCCVKGSNRLIKHLNDVEIKK